MAFFSLLSIDPALGRLDYESLSDQALMEMLFDGLIADGKEEFQDANGNYLDVSDWWGILVLEGRVRNVIIKEKEFRKEQFPFQFVPPQISLGLTVASCGIQGTLNTSLLPQSMIALCLQENDLHGSPDFKAIPRTMKKMDISRNSFSGSLPLADMPDSLIEFRASFNNFSGEISLNNLPRAIHFLYVKGNKLSGSIVIDRLPDEMRNLDLDLSDNAFTDEIHVKALPSNMFALSAGGNPLNKKAVLKKIPEDLDFELLCPELQEIVDEEGNTHAWETVILERNAVESGEEFDSDDY